LTVAPDRRIAAEKAFLGLSVYQATPMAL